MQSFPPLSSKKFNLYEKFIHEKIKSGEINDKNINMRSLSINKSITDNFVMKYKDLKSWLWQNFNKEKITKEFILENKDLLVAHMGILRNGNLTINFLENVLGNDLYDLRLYQWDELSINPSLTSNEAKLNLASKNKGSIFKAISNASLAAEFSPILISVMPNNPYAPPCSGLTFSASLIVSSDFKYSSLILYIPAKFKI